MASLDVKEFESALKQAVQAKRISSTKINALTEISLKSMTNDTQLVSILYRTHKSLSKSYKVASLYAFDAVARAARREVNKRGLTGDMNTQPGNSATFLLKLEGVLDGLFKDMVSSGAPEGKEKAKKILDIWVNSNTFPSAVLTRLGALLKDDNTASDSVESATPPDPRARSQTIVTPPAAVPASPAAVTIDPTLQSTLLSLLAQAKNVSGFPANGQTPPNTGPPAPATQIPQLNANQLNLYQQLAQTAQSGAANPPNPNFAPQLPSSAPLSAPRPYPHPHVPPLEPRAGPSAQYPTHDPLPSTRGSWQGERGQPPRRREHEQFADDYHDREFRGRRGGGFRGRGRGRRDDGGNYRDRYQDRDRSPVSRARRSRSRSPPRSRYAAGRRDVKPYSPPHRPSAAEAGRWAAEPPPGSRKDEFGRDIRAADEGIPSGDGIAEVMRSPSASASVSTLLEAPPRANSLVPPEAPRVASNSNGPPDVNRHNMSSVGLESFNYSTFDFTAPTSWEALGKAWQISRGVVPSQEELMTFAMARGLGPMPAANPPMPQQVDAWKGQAWMGNEQERGGWGGPRGGGRGRGGFGPRGGQRGYSHGNARDGQEQWGYGGNGYSNGTDAIVLGGDTQHQPMGEAGWEREGHVQETYDDIQNAAGGQQVGASGSMQRVDGKWVFVRADASS